MVRGIDERLSAAAARLLLCTAMAAVLVCGGRAFAADEPQADPGQEDPLASLETMPYLPKESVSGKLRLAGATTLQQAASHWCDGFSRIHPSADCTVEVTSSDGGWRALLDGKADVALLSRPVNDADQAAWEKETGRKLATVVAGFNRLVWVVNEANPITSLPWSPEGGVLRTPTGTAAAADATPVATNWDRLNGDPQWAGVAIDLHGNELGSGTRWHMDRLLTGTAPCLLGVREHKTTAEVAEAVAGSRGGLGLIGDTGANWLGVKKLSLVVQEGATPLADHVAGSARTPDCRPLFIAVALPKEGGLPALQREFMAYVLSHPGQLDAAKDGLLPLDRGEVHAQKERLGWPVER